MPFMNRRSFVKSAAMCSLGVFLPRSREARAQLANAPLYLMFDAKGAWDPSRLMDPRGSEPYSSHYTEADIMTVPGTTLRYAPKTVNAGTPVPFAVGPAGNKTDFYVKYGAQLLVVNGLDTQTNSHDVGPRHVWSGNMRSGNPAFAALAASIHEESVGQTLPLSLLSTGGFDFTAGLLPPARVGSPNVLLDLTVPFRISPTSTTNFDRFLHEDSEALVRERLLERSARQQNATLLPYVESVYQKLDDARRTEPAFAPLFDEFLALPTLDAEDAANPLIPKAQVALAAMRAGVCVSANLSLSSFDTHGDHDEDHPVKMQQLLDAIDYTMRTAADLGLSDRLVCMVASDFARTIYNGPPATTTRGKDHWPITSMIMLGQGIAGGRTIGATTTGVDNQGNPKKGAIARLVKVNQGELIVTDDTDPDGFLIRPGHIHDALRELVGIRNHPLAVRYELADVGTAPLPIFG